MSAIFETVQASPLQTTADSGTPFRITITFSEPGVFDLARLSVAAYADALVANRLIRSDLSDFVQITQISLNGATLFVRGRNTPAPPNCFQPDRDSSLVDLPSAIRVNSGATLEVTAQYTATGMVGQAVASVPFIPDRYKGMSDPYERLGYPGGAEVVVGSPTATLASGFANLTDFVFTSSDEGVIDLDRMWIQGSVAPQDPAAAGGVYTPADSMDLARSLLVAKIQVRSDLGLINGLNTPVAPGALWTAPRGRSRVRLGRWRLGQGDTITVSMAQLTTLATLQTSWGAPFWPLNGIGDLGACDPCAK